MEEDGKTRRKVACLCASRTSDECYDLVLDKTRHLTHCGAAQNHTLKLQLVPLQPPFVDKSPPPRLVLQVQVPKNRSFQPWPCLEMFEYWFSGITDHMDTATSCTDQEHACYKNQLASVYLEGTSQCALSYWTRVTRDALVAVLKKGFGLVELYLAIREGFPLLAPHARGCSWLRTLKKMRGDQYKKFKKECISVYTQLSNRKAAEPLTLDTAFPSGCDIIYVDARPHAFTFEPAMQPLESHTLFQRVVHTHGTTNVTWKDVALEWSHLETGRVQYLQGHVDSVLAEPDQWHKTRTDGSRTLPKESNPDLTAFRSKVYSEDWKMYPTSHTGMESTALLARKHDPKKPKDDIPYWMRLEHWQVVHDEDPQTLDEWQHHVYGREFWSYRALDMVTGPKTRITSVRLHLSSLTPMAHDDKKDKKDEKEDKKKDARDEEPSNVWQDPELDRAHCDTPLQYLGELPSTLVKSNQWLVCVGPCGNQNHLIWGILSSDAMETALLSPHPISITCGTCHTTRHMELARTLSAQWGGAPWTLLREPNSRPITQSTLLPVDSTGLGLFRNGLVPSPNHLLTLLFPGSSEPFDTTSDSMSRTGASWTSSTHKYSHIEPGKELDEPRKELDEEEVDSMVTRIEWENISQIDFTKHLVSMALHVLFRRCWILTEGRRHHLNWFWHLHQKDSKKNTNPHFPSQYQQYMWLGSNPLWTRAQQGQSLSWLLDMALTRTACTLLMNSLNSHSKYVFTWNIDLAIHAAISTLVLHLPHWPGLFSQLWRDVQQTFPQCFPLQEFVDTLQIQHWHEMVLHYPSKSTRSVAYLLTAHYQFQFVKQWCLVHSVRIPSIYMVLPETPFYHTRRIRALLTQSDVVPPPLDMDQARLCTASLVTSKWSPRPLTEPEWRYVRAFQDDLDLVIWKDALPTTWSTQSWMGISQVQVWQHTLLEALRKLGPFSPSKRHVWACWIQSLSRAFLYRQTLVSEIHDSTIATVKFDVCTSNEPLCLWPSTFPSSSVSPSLSSPSSSSSSSPSSSSPPFSLSSSTSGSNQDALELDILHVLLTFRLIQLVGTPDRVPGCTIAPFNVGLRHLPIPITTWVVVNITLPQCIVDAALDALRTLDQEWRSPLERQDPWSWVDHSYTTINTATSSLVSATPSTETGERKDASDSDMDMHTEIPQKNTSISIYVSPNWRWVLRLACHASRPRLKPAHQETCVPTVWAQEQHELDGKQGHLLLARVCLVLSRVMELASSPLSTSPSSPSSTTLTCPPCFTYDALFHSMSMTHSLTTRLWNMVTRILFLSLDWAHPITLTSKEWLRTTALNSYHVPLTHTQVRDVHQAGWQDCIYELRRRFLAYSCRREELSLSTSETVTHSLDPRMYALNSWRTEHVSAYSDTRFKNATQLRFQDPVAIRSHASQEAWFIDCVQREERLPSCEYHQDSSPNLWAALLAYSYLHGQGSLVIVCDESGHVWKDWFTALAHLHVPTLWIDEPLSTKNKSTAPSIVPLDGALLHSTFVAHLGSSATLQPNYETSSSGAKHVLSKGATFRLRECTRTSVVDNHNDKKSRQSLGLGASRKVLGTATTRPKVVLIRWSTLVRAFHSPSSLFLWKHHLWGMAWHRIVVTSPVVAHSALFQSLTAQFTWVLRAPPRVERPIPSLPTLDIRVLEWKEFKPVFYRLQCRDCIHVRLNHVLRHAHASAHDWETFLLAHVLLVMCHVPGTARVVPLHSYWLDWIEWRDQLLEQWGMTLDRLVSWFLTKLVARTVHCIATNTLPSDDNKNIEEKSGQEDEKNKAQIQLTNGTHHPVPMVSNPNPIHSRESMISKPNPARIQPISEPAEPKDLLFDMDDDSNMTAIVTRPLHDLDLDQEPDQEDEATKKKRERALETKKKREEKLRHKKADIRQAESPSESWFWSTSDQVEWWSKRDALHEYHEPNSDLVSYADSDTLPSKPSKLKTDSREEDDNPVEWPYFFKLTVPSEGVKHKGTHCMPQPPVAIHSVSIFQTWIKNHLLHISAHDFGRLWLQQRDLVESLYRSICQTQTQQKLEPQSAASVQGLTTASTWVWSVQSGKVKESSIALRMEQAADKAEASTASTDSISKLEKHLQDIRPVESTTLYASGLYEKKKAASKNARKKTNGAIHNGKNAKQQERLDKKKLNCAKEVKNCMQLFSNETWAWDVDQARMFQHAWKTVFPALPIPKETMDFRAHWVWIWNDVHTSNPVQSRELEAQLQSQCNRAKCEDSKTHGYTWKLVPDRAPRLTETKPAVLLTHVPHNFMQANERQCVPSYAGLCMAQRYDIVIWTERPKFWTGHAVSRYLHSLTNWSVYPELSVSILPITHS